MKEIGGYFQIELDSGEEFHTGVLRLNTGRNCLEYILRAGKYSKIYLPFYSCDSLLEPLHKLKIPFEYYRIDEKFRPLLPAMDANSAVLYINYFGICDNIAIKTAAKFINTIIDNSQSFFSKRLKKVDTFYSCRKFFGVPDGAYLYTEKRIDEKLEKDISYERMSHLLIRCDISAEKGFDEFHRNEHLLAHQPMRRISDLTAGLLSSLNYSRVMEIRRKNFEYLHSHLEKINELMVEKSADNSVPMIYPFLVKSGKDIKGRLIKEHIYVATYWPNVFDRCEVKSWEYYLASNLVAFPIDQRYSIEDMDYILQKLL
jgi:hypothetical protein